MTPEEQLASIIYFEGYASIFNNEDIKRDIILPGAFSDSIKNRKSSDVMFLWEHSWDEPIGVLYEISEDLKGLFIRGRLYLRSTYSEEISNPAYGLSIGFLTLKSDIRSDGVRLIHEIDLYEISLVAYPANQQTNISISIIKEPI